MLRQAWDRQHPKATTTDGEQLHPSASGASFAADQGDSTRRAAMPEDTSWRDFGPAWRSNVLAEHLGGGGGDSAAGGRGPPPPSKLAFPRAVSLPAGHAFNVRRYAAASPLGEAARRRSSDAGATAASLAPLPAPAAASPDTPAAAARPSLAPPRTRQHSHLSPAGAAFFAPSPDPGESGGESSHARARSTSASTRFLPSAAVSASGWPSAARSPGQRVSLADLALSDAAIASILAQTGGTSSSDLQQQQEEVGSAGNGGDAERPDKPQEASQSGSESTTVLRGAAARGGGGDGSGGCSSTTRPQQAPPSEEGAAGAPSTSGPRLAQQSRAHHLMAVSAQLSTGSAALMGEDGSRSRSSMGAASGRPGRQGSAASVACPRGSVGSQSTGSATTRSLAVSLDAPARGDPPPSSSTDGGSRRRASSIASRIRLSRHSSAKARIVASDFLADIEDIQDSFLFMATIELFIKALPFAFLQVYVLMVTRSFTKLSVGSIALTFVTHSAFVVYEATRSRIIGYGAQWVPRRRISPCWVVVVTIARAGAHHTTALLACSPQAYSTCAQTESISYTTPSPLCTASAASAAASSASP